jgi:hypothetical protein
MREYGRELTYEELMNMIGEEVLVRDTLGRPDDEPLAEQKCIVSVNEQGIIMLENATFIFEYDKDHRCEYAQFYVHEITR